MRLRLIPRDDAFEDLLVEMANSLLSATNLVAEMLGADVRGREALAAQIAEHEAAGDDARHRLVARVNSTLVTPFDRGDILGLAQGVDDCIDRLELVADMVVMLRPKEFPGGVNDQVGVLQRQAELVIPLLGGLRHGRDQAATWVEINRLENRADRIYRHLVAELLSDGVRRYGSVEEMLKVREVVGLLEAATDAFERLAGRVELIAAKEH